MKLVSHQKGMISKLQNGCIYIAIVWNHLLTRAPNDPAAKQYRLIS